MSSPDTNASKTTRPYVSGLGLLRDAGLRPTRQRLALANLLFSGRDRHVTAETLHGEALAKGEKVSLATVYNTLNQFTEAGLLKQVVVDPHRVYFDTNTSVHHHYYFSDDNRLQDIDQDKVTFAALPDAPNGTRMERIEVIFHLRNR